MELATDYVCTKQDTSADLRTSFIQPESVLHQVTLDVGTKTSPSRDHAAGTRRYDQLIDGPVNH